MRFRETQLDASFRRDGFARTPFLGPEAVAELTELWAEVGPASVGGIYSNVHDCGLEVNRRVDETIARLFGPPLSRLMEGIRLGGGSFLVKGVGPDSASTPHQDWNNVDESRSLSLSIWCPLVDVDESNGALQVLPGSHRLRPSIRSLDTPSLYLEFDDELEPWLTCVPASAGDAVFYAHNLFHGSKPNTTDQIRVAAVTGVLAADAANVHYRRVGEAGAFEILEVERDFYFGGIPDMKAGHLPTTARIVGVVPSPGPQLERAEIIAAARARRRDVA